MILWGELVTEIYVNTLECRVVTCVIACFGAKLSCDQGWIRVHKRKEKG